MDGKNATRDGEVARIAARQHGVVSITQLHAAGVSGDAVRAKVRGGRLHRVHRGVYAVGHAGLSRQGRWMAAVLACGPDGSAVLSHRSAAAAWDPLPAKGDLVEVTVPGNGGRSKRNGKRLHRSRTLTRELTTRRLGIPVTTPRRTISDLERASRSGRGGITWKDVRGAIRQAEVLGLPLGDDNAREPTRSELECSFLRLRRRHGVPTPRSISASATSRPIFCGATRGLVVETDGYRHHRGRAAFEGDRERDLALRTQGYQVLRLTHHQVTTEPGRIAEALKWILAP